VIRNREISHWEGRGVRVGKESKNVRYYLNDPEERVFPKEQADNMKKSKGHTINGSKFIRNSFFRLEIFFFLEELKTL
jgi:hypothetical protein